MKLSISIFQQQVCGGWSNIRYQIIDSENFPDYNKTKKQLAKQFPLKINKADKRFKRTCIHLTFSEFQEKNIHSLNEGLLFNNENLQNSDIEIIFNEWTPHN